MKFSPEMQAQVREIFVAGLQEHFARETQVTVPEIETRPRAWRSSSISVKYVLLCLCSFNASSAADLAPIIYTRQIQPIWRTRASIPPGDVRPSFAFSSDYGGQSLAAFKSFGDFLFFARCVRETESRKLGETMWYTEFGGCVSCSQIQYTREIWAM